MSAVVSTYISKAEAAARLGVRVFIPAFLGVLVTVDWGTTNLSGAKEALLAAAGAGGVAVVSAIGRLFFPQATDSPSTAVKGVK